MKPNRTYIVKILLRNNPGVCVAVAVANATGPGAAYRQVSRRYADRHVGGRQIILSRALEIQPSNLERFLRRLRDEISAQAARVEMAARGVVGWSLDTLAMAAVLAPIHREERRRRLLGRM